MESKDGNKEGEKEPNDTITSEQEKVRSKLKKTLYDSNQKHVNVARKNVDLKHKIFKNFYKCLLWKYY